MIAHHPHETPDQIRHRRIATAPVSARGCLNRALDGKASPRTAIKAQCLECVGFDRTAVTECTAFGCPLWHYRPFRKGSKPSDQASFGTQEAFSSPPESQHSEK